ncbi:mucin-2-like [Procambarus clarkii]|uniref:mucin-2-like n=1 Tax=Procambarus clarkii TaxID=6728 RepID=UPI003741EEC7
MSPLHEEDRQEKPAKISPSHRGWILSGDDLQFLQDIYVPPPMSPLHKEDRQGKPCQDFTIPTCLSNFTWLPIVPARHSYTASTISFAREGETGKTCHPIVVGHLQFMQDIYVSPPISPLHDGDRQENPAKVSASHRAWLPSSDDLQFLQDLCVPPPMSPLHDKERQEKPDKISTTTTSASTFNFQAATFPKLQGGGTIATAHHPGIVSTSQWGPSSQSPSHSTSLTPPPPSQPAQPKTKLIGQSTVKALISTARMTAGNNPREFVRLLKILYKANGLPTFIIPEEVFNAPGSTPTTVEHLGLDSIYLIIKLMKCWKFPTTTDPVEDADSTSDDDDSATAMQTSDPVRVPTAHKTLPPVTPTSATVPVTNHDITVNEATLSDILSAPAPHASPAAAVPSPVSVTNSAAIDPWCDPIEGTYYAAPSAAVPTTATQPPRTQPSRHQPSRTQPSRTLPQRVNTPALHSSDESDEDVSVGTPSPPRKDHLQASTRNVTTKTDKPKKKTNDQSLVKSTRKKTTNELI